MVVNYVGPEDGAGFKVYLDGEFAADCSDDVIKSPGDDRIVVGRTRTNEDQLHASLELDEVLLFNATLSEEVIETLNAYV